MPILCSICKIKNTVEGYKLVEVNKPNKNFHKETVITQWCQACLNKYAVSYKTFKIQAMPKLRDTDIKKYNEMLNSTPFIMRYFK